MRRGPKAQGCEAGFEIGTREVASGVEEHVRRDFARILEAWRDCQINIVDVLAPVQVEVELSAWFFVRYGSAFNTMHVGQADDT